MNRKLLAKEIAKIAQSLVGMEFDTKKEMEDYKKEHDVKPGTKLTVKGDKKQQKITEREADKARDVANNLPGGAGTSSRNKDGSYEHYVEGIDLGGDSADLTIITHPANDAGKVKHTISLKRQDGKDLGKTTVENGDDIKGAVDKLLSKGRENV